MIEGLGTAAAASRRAATAAAEKRVSWGEKPELAPLSAALRHGAGSEEVSPGLVQAVRGKGGPGWAAGGSARG